MKPEIIVTGRLLPRTQEALDRIFTCHKLYEAADHLAFLRQHAQQVRALATFGASGADAALMDQLPKLEIISNFGVGVDAIDLAAAAKRRIIVTNTPEVLTECVADTAMALVLATLRRLPQSENYLRAGQWGTRGAYPLTTSLGGKTLGVLGLGRIGEAIAKRAEAFGMKLRYHNRSRKNLAWPYEPDVVSLAKNSDVLLVAAPGGPQTQRIVNAAVLDALGPQGFVVNIARGSLIDEPALLRYLREGRIAGAGLDVFDNEPKIDPAWFSLDNAVLLPHVGSATEETRTAMGALQVENLQLHFAGKPVKTPVT
ncbi:MAG: 2-hydroxyacid dehydrogenase [Betaproteobacteria bacterium]|nr:2-hydroxyacid dehydrogenase [Betaproteobacteria bacterium]